MGSQTGGLSRTGRSLAFQLANYDYRVEYQTRTTHRAVDELSRVQKSEKIQDVIDDEVPSFATEGSSGAATARV